MLVVDIPSSGTLRLAHLVVDYNGTLAIDGRLIAGVADRLRDLSTKLSVHVVTGDTFGKARAGLAGIPCTLSILDAEGQAQAKLDYVLQLGAKSTACIGNGRNDALALLACALGIAVLQPEGAAGASLQIASLVVPNVLDALDLLRRPLRLVATLRG